MIPPRLKDKYHKDVIPALQQQFQYKNKMQVPKLVKICLNQGVGGAIADKKLIDTGVEEMSLVAGQRAVQTKSKRDISNFKLRKGMPIGVNDKGFDGRGNFTLGISEQIIFPEINIDNISKIQGMDITFVTTAKTDIEAHALLKEFGIPFKNQK